MELIFATGNRHKLAEVQALLGDRFVLKTAADCGITEEIPEEEPTLEENATAKSSYLYTHTGKNCFADDTGLEVNALDGAPGVHSARYAGAAKSDEANRTLLLERLREHTDRQAQFRTVISLIIEGHEHQFEGVVRGHIIDIPRGTDGFGYDPIFVPEGYNQTFAEMDLSEKNHISHRGKAIRKLVDFLKTGCP